LSTRALIEQILDQRRFAVAGASRDPEKFGYKVYKALKAAGYTVYPVNPNAEAIDGDTCYPTLDNIPDTLDCVVTVTQPAVTEEIARAAGHLKIPYIWMQPGSESTPAFNIARAYSMQIVSGGPCIMVATAERRARNAAAA
jgi:predicted CoA-binding protein